MPKTKISEYSQTPASNTDIGGIDIDENCLPSNLNDAIRELMSQLKEFQDGSSGDPIINTADSQFNGTGALKIPVGTVAQRPTPAAGMLRFNDDTDEFEGYNGTAWASVGGSAIANDTTTSTDVYPAFLSATSGTAANIYTSNAKLLYKPSTGEFKSPELVASNGIVVNSQTVTADYTIPSGSNAMSAGAVAVASGVTVTVSSGSVWTIV